MMVGRRHPGSGSQPSSARISRTPSYNNAQTSSVSGGGGGGDGGEDPWSAADVDETLPASGAGVSYFHADERIVSTTSNPVSCPLLPPLHPSSNQALGGANSSSGGGSGSGGGPRSVSPVPCTAVAMNSPQPPQPQQSPLAAAPSPQPALSAELGILMADVRRWKVDRSRHRAGLGAGRLSAVAVPGQPSQQQNFGRNHL